VSKLILLEMKGWEKLLEDPYLLSQLASHPWLMAGTWNVISFSSGTYTFI
jgi:hypothetical protein